MGVKQWSGLFALVLLVSVQVQGSWWNPEPEVAAVDDIVQRDGVTCTSPDDCLPDECCLASAKQSARTKRWFFDAAPSQGVCQRLGTDGSPCIVPLDEVFPDPAKEIVPLDLSPCASEFICVAGSEETGTCEQKQSETDNTDDDNNEEAAFEESNNDEELAENDAPSENDVADNDDTNNYNADEAEPVSEEKEEDEEEKVEEWEEEEKKPLENTNDDFPEESVDDQ